MTVTNIRKTGKMTKRAVEEVVYGRHVACWRAVNRIRQEHVKEGGGSSEFKIENGLGVK